jgi:hypothetical protein
MSLFRTGGKGPPYSDEQIRVRLPIWCALADLFLDTELQPHHYAWIAKTIGGRGFSGPQLLAILHEEVAPAFAHNIFLDVAGEWVGWPDDYVRERVVSSLQNGPYCLLPDKQVAAYVEEEWARIEPHLA